MAKAEGVASQVQNAMSFQRKRDPLQPAYVGLSQGLGRIQVHVSDPNWAAVKRDVCPRKQSWSAVLDQKHYFRGRFHGNWVGFFIRC